MSIKRAICLMVFCFGSLILTEAQNKSEANKQSQPVIQKQELDTDAKRRNILAEKEADIRLKYTERIEKTSGEQREHLERLMNEDIKKLYKNDGKSAAQEMIKTQKVDSEEENTTEVDAEHENVTANDRLAGSLKSMMNKRSIIFKGKLKVQTARKRIANQLKEGKITKEQFNKKSETIDMIEARIISFETKLKDEVVEVQEKRKRAVALMSNQ